ncbi:MAG: 1-acyl-sn-glycerol-3-phosphate acyltransferase [Clostridia bacterium]|nr:1-acyl-sn-glycerol-3-phosphate acyltransferase [Clostridia bacterium]
MVYVVLRAIARLLFRLVYRWRVEGLEHVPRDGPLLVCANHTSYLDPPAVACALPRPVRFIAKAELFRVPGLGALMRWFGAIPVRRGTADRAAIRRALAALAAGEVVCIFPQGTRVRHGATVRVQPGAALLAVRSGAPVLPVAIRGGERLFRPLLVRVGRPIRIRADGHLRQEDLSRIATQEIMGSVEELLLTTSLRSPGGAGEASSPAARTVDGSAPQRVNAQ